MSFGDKRIHIEELAGLVIESAWVETDSIVGDIPFLMFCLSNGTIVAGVVFAPASSSNAIGKVENVSIETTEDETIETKVALNFDSGGFVEFFTSQKNRTTFKIRDHTFFEGMEFRQL